MSKPHIRLHYVRATILNREQWFAEIEGVFTTMNFNRPYEAIAKVLFEYSHR